MANINSLTGFLGDVANAIREKDGIAGNIYPKDYDNRIRNISSSSKVDNLYSFSFRDGKATSYDDNIASINTNCVQNLDNAFYNCTNLTTLNEFNTSNVKSMKNMLYNCNKLSNQSLNNLCSLLPLYSNITDSTKTNRLTYLGLLENQIGNIPEEFINIAEAKGWNLQQLLEYLISLNGQEYFSLEYSLKTETNNAPTLRNYLNNSVNTNALINTIVLDNVSSITNWLNMFKNYKSIHNITINKIDNLKYASSLCSGCSNLVSFEINNFNSEKVILNGSFFNCKNLLTIPMFLNNNQVKILTQHSMFANCVNMVSSIPNWILDNALDFSGIYQNCRNIFGTIPNWQIINHNENISVDMRGAFTNCRNLTGSIPNWNIGSNSLLSFENGTAGEGGSWSGTYDAGTFTNCSNLTGLIPNWNCFISNLSHTFEGCSNLTGSIPAFKLSTNRVIGFYYTFSNCYNLQGCIPMNSFCTEQTEGFYYTFANCYNITDCEKFIVENYRSLPNLYPCFSDLFHKCNNLSNTAIINIVESLPIVYHTMCKGPYKQGYYSENLTSIGLSETQIQNLPLSTKNNVMNKGWILPNTTDITTNKMTITGTVNISGYGYEMPFSLNAFPGCEGHALRGYLHGGGSYLNITVDTPLSGECDFLCGYPEGTKGFYNARYIKMSLINVTNLYRGFFHAPVCHINSMNFCNCLNTAECFSSSHLYEMSDVNCNIIKSYNSYSMFDSTNITNVNIVIGNNMTNMSVMYGYCYNLKEINIIGKSNQSINVARMFTSCNNLSNNSIKNIVKFLLNSNIQHKILNNSGSYNTPSYNSPLYRTKFNNSYYTEYHSQLAAAGWIF